MLIRAEPVFESKSNSSVRVHAEWEMLRLSRMKRDRGHPTSNIGTGEKSTPTFRTLLLYEDWGWRWFAVVRVDIGDIPIFHAESDIGRSGVQNPHLNLVVRFVVRFWNADSCLCRREN
jgi:hypothetical protein